MKNFRNFLYVALLAFVMGACSSSDDDGFKPYGGKGAYVLNEGSANSTVSFYSNDSVKVLNNFYERANGKGNVLGQYAQTMVINDDRAYVVVTTGDGNGYIDVIDMNTFKSVDQVADKEKLTFPREMVVVSNDRAYISNGKNNVDNNVVYEFDLTTNTIVGEIKVGVGPEKMINLGNRLFVANSGGFDNSGKTVSVIDLDKKAVVETITVGACPVDMDLDADNNLWVFCNGTSNPVTWARENLGLTKVNTATYETKTFDLGAKFGYGVKSLVASKDGKYIYYANGGLFRMAIDATALPTEKFITKAEYKDVTFYGIDVEPKTGDLYCVKGGETFGASGSLVVFDKEGTYKAAYQVGVSPNSSVFNY